VGHADHAIYQLFYICDTDKMSSSFI